MLGPDPRSTSGRSGSSARGTRTRYPKYEAMLERVADVVEPTLTMTPPDLQRPGLRGLLAPARARAVHSAGSASGGVEAVEVLTGAARDILDRWFESTELKSTLATDAIIGAMATPSMPGTAYVLFHHVMGETNGQRGVWGYVARRHGRADPGARRARRRGLGVEIRCEAEVTRDPRPGRPRRRRGPRQRRGAPGARRRQQRRRPRHVHGASSRRASCPPSSWPPSGDQLRERLAEDQRRPGRAAGLPRPARHQARARSTAARSTSVPTRTTSSARYDDAKYGRPSARPDPRVHHPLGGGPTRWRRRASTSCRCSSSTRRTRCGEGHLGRAPGAVRRPLLRRCSTSTRRTSAAR